MAVRFVAGWPDYAMRPMTDFELANEFNELVEDFGYDGCLDLGDPQTEEDREFVFDWAEEQS